MATKDWKKRDTLLWVKNAGKDNFVKIAIYFFGGTYYPEITNQKGLVKKGSFDSKSKAIAYVKDYMKSH